MSEQPDLVERIARFGQGLRHTPGSWEREDEDYKAWFRRMAEDVVAGRDPFREDEADDESVVA